MQGNTSRRAEEASLRARIHALVENATMEQLRACEAVLQGSVQVAEGRQRRTGHGPSRRKSMAAPASVRAAEATAGSTAAAAVPVTGGVPSTAAAQSAAAVVPGSGGAPSAAVAQSAASMTAAAAVVQITEPSEVAQSAAGTMTAGAAAAAAVGPVTEPAEVTQSAAAAAGGTMTAGAPAAVGPAMQQDPSTAAAQPAATSLEIADPAITPPVMLDEAQVPVPELPAVPGESVRDGDGQTMRMMSYDTKFVQSVAYSTLIGNRYDHEDITGQEVVDGINMEFQRYLDEVGTLRAAGREADANELFTWGRRFILPSYSIHALTSEGCDPKIGAVQLYSAETGVYPVVNTVMRNHDEAKLGFKAYVRLLHDTLCNPVPPMFRWGGTCFRWMKLPEDMVSQYDIDVYEISNYISFAGFTSASRTREATWWNKVQFQGSNVLLVIDQENGTVGPTDISYLSEFPEEAEVMYALGQTFKKKQKILATFDELRTHLGEPPVDDNYPLDYFRGDARPVHIVFLTAVDVFHELAEDLFRGGGTAEEALPLLHKRLDIDIQSGHDARQAESNARQAQTDARLLEAKSLLTLGKANGKAAHYQTALDFIQRSKDLLLLICFLICNKRS